MMTFSINTGSLMLDTLPSDALQVVFADTGRRLREHYSGDRAWARWRKRDGEAVGAAR